MKDFATEREWSLEDLVEETPKHFSSIGPAQRAATRDAHDALVSLEGLSEAHCRLRAGNSTRFHRLELVELSLARARSLWHVDPAKARRLAQVALAAAQKLPRSVEEDRALRYEELARAWLYLANAHRLRGDLLKADAALEKRCALLPRDQIHLEAQAEALSVESSLRKDQRRFEEAKVAASKAERLYLRIGRVESSASMVLLEAAAWAELGRRDHAIKRLRGVLKRLPDWAAGSRVHFGVVQNLAFTLAENGSVDEAMNLVPEVEGLAKFLDEQLIDARTDWLKGLVAQGLGKVDSAIREYERVQRVFLDSGNAYDAALVSLDLAVALLEDGRHREVVDLSRDLMGIFRSRGIHREATAAGLLVAEALQKGTASVDLVQRAARYLRRARRDPTYRFAHSS